MNQNFLFSETVNSDVKLNKLVRFLCLVNGRLHEVIKLFKSLGFWRETELRM
jgi:hypothetical protein